MSILYCGDIHSNAKAVAKIDSYCNENNISTVVQVGDFGIHFNKDHNPLLDFFEKREHGPLWISCGGNHDNWPVWQAAPPSNNALNDSPLSNLKHLAPGCLFAERGSLTYIDNKLHLFFGCAESSDRHVRTEGIDWWREESPSWNECQKFGIAYDEAKPEIVITHDCPWSVKIYHDPNPSTTRDTLEQVWKHIDHKPKLWYFGHHHLLQEWEIQNTKFRCCGIEGHFWFDDQKNKV